MGQRAGSPLDSESIVNSLAVQLADESDRPRRLQSSHA
ncbi:hypothetical protein Lp90_0941 [Lactiplantibacillus plantarum]|nr:hypothetical protein Lp90_0941 [Lactiplantibacillus plantarum]